MLDKFKVELANSLLQLKSSEGNFIELFKHGSLSVELYRPDKIDPQMPHDKDEIYVIISGHGAFVLEDERTTFSPGDILFVPAKATHRFENFTDNFATWVLFFGPVGGENEKI